MMVRPQEPLMARLQRTCPFDSTGGASQKLIDNLRMMQQVGQIVPPLHEGCMTTSNEDQCRRRLELVNEHVRQENARDVAGILATFGLQPSYHDEPWQDHREGAEGVRQYYEELIA